MVDVTFQPLHGQDEVAIAGIVFSAGETISFGDGSNGFTDDDAERILTNPNFIDAELGRNPNFTCVCGHPIEAFAVDPDLGRVRTGNTDCGNPACAHGIDDEPFADATPAVPTQSKPPASATEDRSEAVALPHVDAS